MDSGRGPFLKIKSAAEYCDYSAKVFAEKAMAGKLPRYGEKRNRFARTDLDLWMNDPEYFVKREKSQPVHRRSGRSFTPVAA